MVVKKMNTDGFVSNAEVELRSAADHRMRSLLSASRDRSPAGSEDTVHLLVKNIEQKRLAEEQIAQADKLASIGQLSSGIAHEINNPLGIILGYTQLLLRQTESDSATRQDLKTIEKHVRSCKGIVEDLLHFARTSDPEKTVTHVDQVLDEVLKFVLQHGELDAIEIERDYDPNLPAMLLDEKKIKQMFMNLIMNAKHAMGKDGRLKVSTIYRAATAQAEIELSDNGHGIERKNLPRVFDPFFTTKPTGEGTGLGLSVSYGIVKNHGGEIKVESLWGHGTTFTIILPVHLSTEVKQNGEIHSDR
jgi:signal transduction histidine kinase